MSLIEFDHRSNSPDSISSSTNPDRGLMEISGESSSKDSSNKSLVSIR